MRVVESFNAYWAAASPLVRLQFRTAIVQWVSWIVMFGITDPDARAPYYTLYWRRNEDVSLTCEGSAAVGYYSAIFLLLSAVNHSLCATFHVWYEECVANGSNPLRWAEYFFSASLMHVMIAQLCGVADVYLLFAIAALTAVTMTFGWLQEVTGPALRKEQETYSLAPFVLGFLPWIAQWIIILAHFVHAGSPPAWVSALMFLEIALDSLFALVMFVSQRRNVSFERIEVGYLILSLTAKQLLAWVNFGGTKSL